MTHRLRILQPSGKRQWIRLADSIIETDATLIQTLETELEAQECKPAAGLSNCHTRYKQLAEGQTLVLPAGARALAVISPCDGSATCDGLSDGDGASQLVTLSGGLVVQEAVESITERAITISAVTGVTDISWMECE